MKENNKNRIFVIGGPSQLLFLVSALTQEVKISNKSYNDILILSGSNISDKRRDITKSLANKIWDWGKIIWLDQLLVDNGMSLNSFSMTTAKVLRKIIGLKTISELWLCMPFGKSEQFIYYSFPQASIVYSEEGLGGYLNPSSFIYSLKHPSYLKKKVVIYYNRVYYNLRLNKSIRLNIWPLLSFKKSYYLFPKLLKSKKIDDLKRLSIREEIFKEVIEKIGVKSDLNLKQGKCLLLGQCFHKFGMLTWEEEKDIYADACKKIINNGYQIYWKEHPKNDKPFFENLSMNNEVKNLNNYYSFEMPIEIIAKELDFDFFVSGTSTSLLIFKEYYNKQCFTLSKAFKKKLEGRALKVLNLIEDNIEVLPESIKI